MTTLDDYIVEDIISDIAKGRYSKNRVNKMFKEAILAGCQETERVAAEFWCYSFLQDLHYEFGFTKEQMEKLMTGIDEKAAAFDARAYNIDDMKQALKEDAGFTLEFKWNE